MTAAQIWGIGDPSDSELVHAAAGGDREAFAGIYDRYADRLHDFCVGMLRDRDGAADCVQDVFCTAATGLAQLREPDKLRAWLYSIARNEALRRLRERRRETPYDELPDAMAHEPGPDTLAARTELADLIAEAAGGLSDRDRSVLELAYRHGLDGPELAEALGVSPGNANKMAYRLRETIEHSLGALLVSRHARNSADGCPDLAGILHGWDGRFSVLMRKRIARHVESCPVCDEQRRRMVTPSALLGAAPAFIPAPRWLRERTLSDIRLDSLATPIGDQAVDADAADAPQDPGQVSSVVTGANQTSPEAHDDVDDARRGRTRTVILLIALFVVTLGISLSVTIAWMFSQHTTLAPVDVSETVPTTVTTPAKPLPTSSKAPAAPTATTATTVSAIAPPPSTEIPSAQPPATAILPVQPPIRQAPHTDSEPTPMRTPRSTAPPSLRSSPSVPTASLRPRATPPSQPSTPKSVTVRPSPRTHSPTRGTIKPRIVNPANPPR